MTQVTAREIMSTPVVTVHADTPIQDVAALMLRSEVAALPVVDAGMHLLGLVTEDDLLRRDEAVYPHPRPPAASGRPRPLWLEHLVERCRMAEGTTARQLMTSYVVTADESTEVRELARVMLARNVDRVPILREGRLVGIVTRTDVLKAFVRGDAALVDAVRDALRDDLHLDPSELVVSCEDGVVTIAGRVPRHSDCTRVARWIRSIDGVVGVDAEALRYYVDDLALRRTPPGAEPRPGR